MAGKPKDITGNKYGRLTAIARTENRAANQSYKWIFRCDCGVEKELESGNVIKGSTVSCGCVAKEQLKNLIESKGGAIHGMKGSKAWKSWAGLVSRSSRDNLKNYEEVAVCDSWNPEKGGGFLNFLEDMGEPEKGQSINRIKGAKIYSKETCEWANRSIQGYDQKRNRRNTTGKSGVMMRGNKYVAYITKDKVKTILGSFNTFEEAVSCREEAEIKYFGFLKGN